MTRVDLARLSDVASGIPSGTSFPGSPANNDIFYRTDRDILYFYNGTRWLSVQLFHQTISLGTAALTATGQINMNVIGWGGTYDLWLESGYFSTNVATPNDGTKYWTVTCYRLPSATALTNFNTSADTFGVFTSHVYAIGALSGTTDNNLQVSYTKTSTPGNLTIGAALTYRLVG